MKRIVNVTIIARFGVLRVLEDFQPQSRSQASQVRDIHHLFRFTPEEEEEVGLTQVSPTEKIARGLPQNAVVHEWDPQFKDHVWTKELSISESELLKNALDSYARYRVNDEWQDDLVEQIGRKQTREDKTEKTA